MHRLEITGATPEELYFNSVKMLAMLLRPPQAVPAEPGNDAPPVESAGAECQPQVAAEGASPSGADQTQPVAAKPKRAARGSKNTEAKNLNDEIPDLTGGASKTIEHKELTLDGDIRPRLRAIQKACTERGNDMKACVAYILQLYGPFGVTKADQLKTEQFAEFLEASEGYLSGEA